MEEMVVERDICWEGLSNCEPTKSIEEVIDNGERCLEDIFIGFEYILVKSLN